MACRARYDLSWIEVLTPVRENQELIGDAIEWVRRKAMAGQLSKARYRLKIWSTVFWLVMTVIRSLPGLGAARK